MEKSPLTELEQLTLTSAAKRFLSETASWSKFLAIIGIIFIVFMLIAAIFVGSIFDTLPQAQTLPFNAGIYVSIFYALLALLYIFPVYYSLKFSSKIKSALQSKNDEVLAKGLEMLKSNYKFIGVTTIIFISLYILIIAATVMGSAFA